jgi:membrane protease YdiL (CAAX protease family)
MKGRMKSQHMMTSPTPSSNKPRESWGRLIGTLLLVLAVLGIVLYSTIVLSIKLGAMRQPTSRVATFLIGTTVGELAAFGVLVWLLHRRGSSLRDLGWRQPTRWGAIALGIGIAIVYGAFTALNPHVGAHLLEFSWLKLLAIGAAVVAGMVEETIFRGYVMTTLGRMGYGLVVQVMLSGLFFALVHFYAFAAPLNVLLVQGLTFVLGVALAITYVTGKRSLTPVITSHALIDVIIEPWILLSFFQ